MDAHCLLLGKDKCRYYLEPDAKKGSFSLVITDHSRQLKFRCHLGSASITKETLLNALVHKGKKEYKFCPKEHANHVSTCPEKKYYSKDESLVLHIASQYWLECFAEEYLVAHEMLVELNIHNAKLAKKQMNNNVSLFKAETASKAELLQHIQVMYGKMKQQSEEFAQQYISLENMFTQEFAKVTMSLVTLQNAVTSLTSKVGIIERTLYVLSIITNL